jgi:hypothetical protein
MTTPELSSADVELTLRELNMMMATKKTFLAVAAALSLAACGGKTTLEKGVDTMWQWDGGVEASRVLSALEDKTVKPSVTAAVGITSEGLVGRALPDGRLWKYAGVVDVLPSISADMVFFTGAGKLTALSLETGRQLFSVPVDGRRLEGAGSDGNLSVMLLVDADNARQDQVSVFRRDGTRTFRASTDARLGTPAAIDGVGLLPYSSQYVFGFDLESGKPYGRLLYRDGLHTVVARQDQVLLYGGGVSELSTEITSSPVSQSLKLNLPKLPGDPIWPLDGSKPRPARSSPVGVYTYPILKEGKLHFQGGTYAATYFEIIAGFSTDNNRLKWVTPVRRSIVGAAPGPQGTTVCLEDGSLWRIRWEDGALEPYGTLSTKLRACSVAPVDASLAARQKLSLFEQVVSTLNKTGPDMVAMQRVLLKAIANPQSEETTDALLKICLDPMVSSELAREAARLLAGQKAGGEEMVEVLKQHTPRPLEEDPAETDISESEMDEIAKAGLGRAPPVGKISEALVRLKTPGAAAALAPFLLDPSLSATEVEQVMKAVLKLGTTAEAETVESFLDQYKNTGGEKQLINALVLAVQFLLEHMDDQQKATLAQSLSENLTDPDLRKKTEPFVAQFQKPDDEPGADERAQSPKPGKKTTP